jgi:hypothetical protein
MDSNKNILYIGPYNEESNRGRASLNNIKALHKVGHKLKIVPIYYPGEKFKETEAGIINLENTNLDNYDICIQHCDPMHYAFNRNIKKNIGLYTPNNITSEPIINSRLSLLHNVVVNSQIVYDKLSRIVSRDLLSTMKYCPKYIDLQYILDYPKEQLDWIDTKKYYFYTELEFTQGYDWEKIIYVYLTYFIKKNCGLIIKTQNISDEAEANDITKKINDIAMYTNINLQKDDMPKILNGIFDEQTNMQIYNSIDCFIDCGKTYDYNNNVLIAAALGKDLICNSKSPAANLFSDIHTVNGQPCNIHYDFNNDLLSSSMYETHYSMDCESLRDTMNFVYVNQYSSTKIDRKELQQYDMSNINELLC